MSKPSRKVMCTHNENGQHAISFLVFNRADHNCIKKKAHHLLSQFVVGLRNLEH